MTPTSAPLASSEVESAVESAVESSGRHSAVARLLTSLTQWAQRASVRVWAGRLLVVLLLTAAGHFYLAPASGYMLARDRGHMLGGDGDATTLPLIYQVVQEAAHDSVRNLLYGTIYNPRLGAPFGSGMWVPWIERWVVVILGAVLPVEALPAAFVWVLMVLAGLCFYAFARMERWPRVLAFAFAFAFAFNPYTRARATAHAALVGIYCLPLIFLALRYIKREPTPKPKQIALASLLLVLSMWTAHYFIIMLVAISPLLLWFQLRRDEAAPPTAAAPRRGAVWKRFGWLCVVALPAVAFLAWNYLQPLAPGTPATRAAVTPPDSAAVFMSVYAARPIDYFSNDVAFGTKDLNPLRRQITRQVRSDLEGSNTPERSNGIRWSILLPFLLLLVTMCTPFRDRLRRSLGSETWRKLTYWTCFALLMFWFSLSPQSLSVYDHQLGLAAWVNTLFPEFRVPSRFGPFAHFGVLAAVGTFASAHWQRLFGGSAPAWRRSLASIVPLLMVLDYPPLKPVSIGTTYPPRLDLVAAGSGSCGVGMYFPYSPGSASADEVEMYRAYQRLRDTNCRTIQQPLQTDFHATLLRRLGETPFTKSLTRRNHYLNLQKRFVNFVRCARLDWVIFREQVPEPWRRRVCKRLGWVRVADDACVSPTPRAESFADPAPVCTPSLEGVQSQ